MKTFLAKLDLTEKARSTTLSILQSEGVNVQQLFGEISDSELREIGVDYDVRNEIKRVVSKSRTPPRTKVLSILARPFARPLAHLTNPASRIQGRFWQSQQRHVSAAASAACSIGSWASMKLLLAAVAVVRLPQTLSSHQRAWQQAARAVWLRS